MLRAISLERILIGSKWALSKAFSY